MPRACLMQLLISHRSISVLEYLLDTSEYAGIAQIAAALELTPAQVRHSLDELDAWLARNGSALARTQRKGIKLLASESARQALAGQLREARRQWVWLSPQERRELLLFQLLISREPMHLAELSRWLKISRPSLFRDLAFARAWLAERHLTLETYRSEGVEVKASERAWRAAALELLLKHAGQEMVVAACARPGRELDVGGPGAELLNDVSDFLDNLALKSADQLISLVEAKLGIRLDDDASAWLVLSLGLAIYRISLNAVIEPDGDAAAHVPPAVAEAALETRGAIEALLQRDPGDGEYNFICECWMRVAGRDASVQVGTRLPARRKLTAESLAPVLAREAAKYLHAGLLNDQDLTECLCLELSQHGTEQASNETPHHTKQALSISKEDPLVTFASRVLAPLLTSNGWLPTESLVRGLAAHLRTALDRLRRKSVFRKVWVVCGSGMATARNLVSRLNMHLPGVQVLGVASAFEVLHNPSALSAADAVISTIRLDMGNIPVIHVSALLAPDDIDRVLRGLGLEHQDQAHKPVKIPSASKVSLRDVLSTDVIEVVPSADSWQGVVSIAGNLLLRAGAIWPSYIEAMKDMITLYGPYMVVAPGVALLHAGAEMGAKRLAVSMVKLRKPVPFGHETYDPIRIALALSSVDHYSHIQVISEIMDLMGNAQKRAYILRAKTKEQILTSINAQLDAGTGTPLSAQQGAAH